MSPPIVRTRRRHSEKVHGAEADHFQLVLIKNVLTSTSELHVRQRCSFPEVVNGTAVENLGAYH